MASSEPQPAVLTKTSPEIRAEVVRAVSQALGHDKVQIADNSLMETNRLIIERRGAPNVDGYVPLSRDMPMPDHFYLMKTDNGCMLWHEETDTSYPLKSVDCRLNPEK